MQIVQVERNNQSGFANGSCEKRAPDAKDARENISETEEVDRLASQPPKITQGIPLSGIRPACVAKCALTRLSVLSPEQADGPAPAT
jgi:hypothetical protein